ncbi:MAG: HU family DNA-binding protein [Paludibacteraceae bacterium]
MSEKITLQDVTDKLSDKLGVTKKLSDDFLREFFSLIEVSLEKDGVAKIKGLGVFKLKEVEERKSVNVQSGAEIVIPAHYKVSFVPDKALSTDVNKPYAHLETYILDEEGGPVEVPVNPSEEDDDESVLDLEEDDKNSENKMEPQATASSVEKTEISHPVQEVDNPSVQTEAAKPQQEEIPSQMEVAESPVVTETENASVVAAVDEVTAVQPSGGVSEKVKMEEDTSEVPSTEQKPIGRTENNMVGTAADSDDKEEVENGVSSQNTGKGQDKSDDKSEEGDSKWLRFVIIVLILAILGFVGYHYSDAIRNLFSQDKDGAKTMVDNAVSPQIEEPVEEEEVAAIDAEANYDDMSNENFVDNEVREEDPHEGNLQLQTTHSVYNFDKELVDYMKEHHPEAQLNITNVAGVVKLVRGQRLVDLALKYYGHKYFWVYIYYFNTDVIKNPNSLPSGIEVKIPEVNKSLVDYTNEDMVDMAFEIKTNLIEK